jgi:hypothetical protein
MLCNFKQINEKLWKCENCGYEFRKNVKRACSVPQNTHPQNVGPSFLQKAINFSSAVVHDVATGMQRCTEEEMDERIEICKTCPFYNHEDSSCNKCGCPLSREKIYRNKLYWKSSGCPIGKWPDLTENTKDDIN